MSDLELPIELLNDKNWSLDIFGSFASQKGIMADTSLGLDFEVSHESSIG